MVFPRKNNPNNPNSLQTILLKRHLPDSVSQFCLSKYFNSSKLYVKIKIIKTKAFERFFFFVSKKMYRLYICVLTAGEAWNRLSAQEKKPYEVKHAALKEEYEAAMADYAAGGSAKKAKANNGAAVDVDDDDEDDEEEEDDESD